MDYNSLLNNPEFKNFLKAQGFKQSSVVEEKEEYNLTFSDGISRKVSWNFVTLFSLTTLMEAAKITKLEANTNWIHFSLLLYSMMLPYMVDAETSQKNDKYLDFDAFIQQLPTEEEKLIKLMAVVNNLLNKEKKELIIK